MPPAHETRTVRIAADLAEEKLRWMARFGWALVSREERPYTGDVLVEREMLSVSAPPRFDRVAVLRLTRRASSALTEAEAEFWHPTLVPPALITSLVLLRWVAFALPLLALQWIVLLHAVDHGTDAAVRVALRGFVAPIGVGWALAVGGLEVGTLWVRRVRHDPGARARRERARREWALARADGILRAASK